MKILKFDAISNIVASKNQIFFLQPPDTDDFLIDDFRTKAGDPPPSTGARCAGLHIFFQKTILQKLNKNQ